MKTVKKRSVVPVYAVGAAWLIYAWFLPLYRPLDYLVCGLTSLLVFLTARSIFPTRVIQEPDSSRPSEAPKPEAQPEPEKEESSLTPEQRELTAGRDRALSELRRLNDNITGPTLTAQISHMESTTQSIFAYVLEHPEKKSQIRRFLNYYLPTTIKLLNAYDRMDGAGVSGANIDGTKGKIEQMLGSVAAAFDRQLDALFRDEALDISADIKVLEQMMAQEGLTENTDFKSTPQQ
ncbi:MAG: hypothetical protein HFF18_06140 [Oscillospiraceae bacterium]|nr:hypothetical protein [Oscillospiraceae bacterium]